MNNWISALAELQARGEPGILVTIIGAGLHAT